MGQVKTLEDRLNLLRMRSSILMLNFEADRFGDHPRGGWEISVFTVNWIRYQSDSLEEVVSKIENMLATKLIIPDELAVRIQVIHDAVKAMENTEYYIMPIGGGWKAGLSRWGYRDVPGGGQAKQPISNRKMVGNHLEEVVKMLETVVRAGNEQ